MATKKKGTLTGHQDIEGNDIRVGDLVEDIHTGKVYLINKYGNLFSETYGTRKISGMNVKIVDPTVENMAEALVPAPEPEVEEIPEEIDDILENIPDAADIAPAEEEMTPAVEETAPAEEKTAAEESYEIFKDCLESALAKQEQLQKEAREFLTDEFLAALLRERGYTVTAEKEVRYIKSL